MNETDVYIIEGKNKPGVKEVKIEYPAGVKEVIVYLPEKSGVLRIFPKFLNREDRKKVIDELNDLDVWKVGEYNMRGKIVKTPRELASMWDNNFLKSKIKNDNSVIWKKENEWIREGVVWTKNVKKVKNKIEDELGFEIDYAQLNYYKDGNDYIGWHSDDEVPIGSNITSVSFGATRDFVLRHKSSFKNTKTWRDTEPDKRIITKFRLTLRPGTLLIMDRNAGKINWKHTLPKMRSVTKGRFNVTFRKL